MEHTKVAMQSNIKEKKTTRVFTCLYQIKPSNLIHQYLKR